MSEKRKARTTPAVLLTLSVVMIILIGLLDSVPPERLPFFFLAASLLFPVFFVGSMFQRILAAVLMVLVVVLGFGEFTAGKVHQNQKSLRGHPRTMDN
jgi:hypothetical protein